MTYLRIYSCVVITQKVDLFIVVLLDTPFFPSGAYRYKSLAFPQPFLWFFCEVFFVLIATVLHMNSKLAVSMDSPLRSRVQQLKTSSQLDEWYSSAIHIPHDARAPHTVPWRTNKNSAKLYHRFRSEYIIWRLSIDFPVVPSSDTNGLVHGVHDRFPALPPVARNEQKHCQHLGPKPLQ